MSGNKNSGNRSGRGTVVARQAVVAKKTTNTQQPIRQVIDLPKLKALPEMPNSKWKNARAVKIWARLADILVRHQMLTELDLDMLELTVHTRYLLEEQVAAGNLSGNMITKLHSCYKSLGLSSDGRIVQGIGSTQNGDNSESIFGHLLD